jgi:hypothetical protein
MAKSTDKTDDIRLTLWALPIRGPCKTDLRFRTFHGITSQTAFGEKR